MMHHHLRSMAYLLIGILALSSGEWNVVHGFTAPIIRASATAIDISPIPPTTKSIDATTNIVKTTLYFSPRIVLTPSTTTTGPTNTAVVLQAEPTDNNGDSTNNMDANEIIARRIIVVGDVDGGYYRSCVKNEVSNFTFSLLIRVSFLDLFFCIHNLIQTLRLLFVEFNIGFAIS